MDRLQLVTQKFEHARRHAEALVETCRNFLQSEPCKLGFRVEPDRRPAYFVESFTVLPPSIPCLLGDVLHNLRCVLDHVAFQLVLSHSNTDPVDPTRISFPITETREKYEKRRSLPDALFAAISREAAATLDHLAPYRMGNEGLWRLHALNNIDKHRMLLTAAFSGKSVDLGHGHQMLKALESNTALPEHIRKGMIDATKTLIEEPVFFDLAEELFPLRDGDVFLYGAVGEEFNPTVKLKVEVTVSETSVMPPTPIDKLVHSLGQSVAAALNDLAPYLR